MRVRRTRTSENSAATKRALSRMSRAMIRTSNNGGLLPWLGLAGRRGALADSRRHTNGELALRNVTRDDRAGARIGPLADGYRRAQDRVRADESTVADHGPVLLVAVVIGRDRAGAD